MQEKKPNPNRARLRDEDLFHSDANIFERIPNRNFGKNVERDVVVFTTMDKRTGLDALGNPVLDDTNGIAEEQDIAFAKIVSIEGCPDKFYIKVDSSGRLHNPIGIVDEGTHAKYRHHTDIKRWTFAEVNRKVFELYVKFLRTRNLSYLRNAQREML